MILSKDKLSPDFLDLLDEQEKKDEKTLQNRSREDVDMQKELEP